MNNVGMRLRYPTLICLHQKYAQHALAGRSKREGGDKGEKPRGDEREWKKFVYKRQRTV